MTTLTDVEDRLTGDLSNYSNDDLVIISRRIAEIMKDRSIDIELMIDAKRLDAYLDPDA